MRNAVAAVPLRRSTAPASYPAREDIGGRDDHMRVMHKGEAELEVRRCG